jgi:hypothetical protein
MDYSSCALLDDGTVKCWGYNANGVLGLGSTATSVLAPSANVDLGPGRTAKRISSGRSHVCALLDDNTVKCWGGNTNGELGVGNTGALGSSAAQMGAALPALLLP